jgi:S1-C subfamily serine protease
MGIPTNKLAAGTILVAVGAAVGAGFGTYFRSAPVSSPVSQLSNPDLPPFSVQSLISSQNQPTENLNFIALAVAKVGPAVVRIDADSESIDSNPAENGDAPGARLPQRFSAPRGIEREQKGSGSGFIVGADGKIVTNAHVVAGAKSVKVTLKGGRVLTGKVVGIDRVTDVAVVRVNAQNLPIVQLGDSDRLVPGEWAIAIGNPLGLDNTVTIGIVSATGRSSSQVGIPDKRVSFIQTDAAINPGNSGGPLLNARGEVIGINTAIRAHSQGLGFAIPIRTATRISTELFAKGQVEHPYLGVEMVPLTAELKAGIAKEPSLRSKVTAEKGALVTMVVPQSPAETAGIRPGDVIIKIADQSIETPNDVQQQVEASSIGQNLKLDVSREGKVKSIDIKPSLFPTKSPDHE